MKFGVIGAGVTGLATALELSKVGHDVTIIERDKTPMPKTHDEAFEWNRRGAPQVRHSHALLGRLHNILRDNHPEVCLLYTSPSPRDISGSRMPSSA